MKNFSQNPVTKRFLDVLKYLTDNNIIHSKSQFCKDIEYLPQSLNFVIKGERDIPITQISKLFTSYSFISPEWLLTGQGTMLKSSEKNLPAGPSKESAGCTGRLKELEQTISNQQKQIEQQQKIIDQQQKQIDQLLRMLEIQTDTVKSSARH